jgi:hypothetical protein
MAGFQPRRRKFVCEIGWPPFREAKMKSASPLILVRDYQAFLAEHTYSGDRVRP